MWQCYIWLPQCCHSHFSYCHKYCLLHLISFQLKQTFLLLLLIIVIVRILYSLFHSWHVLHIYIFIRLFLLLDETQRTSTTNLLNLELSISETFLAGLDSWFWLYMLVYHIWKLSMNTPNPYCYSTCVDAFIWLNHRSMTYCRCYRTGNSKNCSCVKNVKIYSDCLPRRLGKCQNIGMAPGMQTTISGSSTHLAAAQITLSSLSLRASSMNSSAGSNQPITNRHHIKSEVAKYLGSPSSNNNEHPHENSSRVPPSFIPEASFP